MCRAFGDHQVAVGADPSLAIIGFGSGGGLNRILDAVFDYRFTNTDSYGIKIEFSALSVILARTLGTITARH